MGRSAVEPTVCATVFAVKMAGEELFFLVGPSLEWAAQTLVENGYGEDGFEYIDILGPARNVLVRTIQTSANSVFVH